MMCPCGLEIVASFLSSAQMFLERGFARFPHKITYTHIFQKKVEPLGPFLIWSHLSSETCMLC